MMEGFTTDEIADYLDALRRHGFGFSRARPVRPVPPWSTISGFADKDAFFDALARSWPMLPATGDLINLARIFHSNPPLLNPTVSMAIPYDEFSS